MIRIKMKKEEKIESILNSLDGLQRATPRPFFFTRLEARLDKETVSIADRILNFIKKPAIAFAAVLLIIVINVFGVVLPGSGSETQKAGNNVEVAAIDQYAQMNANPFDIEKVNP